jgi:hypothetical protein
MTQMPLAEHDHMTKALAWTRTDLAIRDTGNPKPDRKMIHVVNESG